MTWSVPLVGNTIHGIGDVQGASTARLRIMMADLARDEMPDVPRVTLGDCTADGTSGDDTYFLNNFSSVIPGGVYKVLGNHDIGNGGGHARTPATAAAVLGMPAKDYVVDLGFAKLIVIGMDKLHTHGTSSVYNNTTLAWLNTQLAADPTKTCIVATHYPLRDTHKPAAAPHLGIDTNDFPWFGVDESSDVPPYTYTDAAIRAVIAANPNCKVWMSGHTHHHPTAKDIVVPKTIGHTVACINTSSILPPGVQQAWTTQISSAYVSVFADRIETRWRNHGTHQWVGCGPNRERVATVTL